MKNIISKCFFFLPVMIITLSCSNKKIENTSVNQQKVINGFFEGVITTKYKDKGCDYVIVGKQKGTEVIYNPVNLDERFKEDGKKISFRYKVTRIVSNGCDLGIYVYIEEFR